MQIVATLLIAATLASGGAEPSPYAGEQHRQIKALSSAEIDGYLAGSGMGFAKAAELNGYPGPKHVLQLADELDLSVSQISETEFLYRAMQREATVLGQQLVATERELDRQFAVGTITPQSLKALVAEIAEVQARIRNTHLQAHLRQRALLTEHQARRYDQLRGYHGSGGSHNH